jgi:hypothetical protein
MGGIMKKMTIFLVVTICICSLFPLISFACDREAAFKVQVMLRDMATWQEKNGKINFTWGSDWDHASSQQRLGLIKSFADSDACLTGSAREIKYYRKGKLVGEASPTTGIKLLER